MRVYNAHIMEECKFKNGEMIRQVFHPANTNGTERPKLRNGASICNRYHTVGFCFTDCKIFDSHRKLEKDEADSFCRFLKSVRENRNSFRNKKNPNRSPQGQREQTKEPNGTGVGPETKSGA